LKIPTRFRDPWAAFKHGQAAGRSRPAKENYALERVENAGLRGPEKYAAAGVTFATTVP
jgi:hypothetical protein